MRERQPTLSDYLRALRRQHKLVIGAVFVAALVALMLSLRQQPTYLAQTSLAFRDEGREINLVGGGAAPAEQPAQIAAANASIVVGTDLLAKVKRDLRTTKSVERLRNSFTATTNPDSNLVILQARGEDPAFVAKLANGIARLAVREVNARSRERFTTAEQSIRRRLERLSDDEQTVAEAIVADQLLRLQALSAVSSPAEVVEFAAVPKAPVAPVPLRDAIFGGLLGLLIGVLAAVARESLDRRLRGSREIQTHFQFPVLGQVKNDALGSVGHLANGRGNSSGADLEAFRILRTNLELLDIDSPLRTVAVTSSSAEEGKTTVATSLALSAAAAGKRTLLIECDLRRPAIASRLGIAPSPGLSDLLSRRASAQEVLQTVTLEDSPERVGGPPIASTRWAGVDEPVGPDGVPTLYCITAGTTNHYAGRLLGSQRFREFLAEAANSYGLVVLDTTPLLPVADTIELLTKVDGLLVCVRSAQTTRDEAWATKDILERLPSRPTGVVVTGTSGSTDR